MAETTLLEKGQYNELLQRFVGIMARFNSELANARQLRSDLIALKAEFAASPMATTDDLSQIDATVAQIDAAFLAGGV